jgi:hypothetical protein
MGYSTGDICSTHYVCFYSQVSALVYSLYKVRM